MKRCPIIQEKKSKRILVALRPSTFEAINKLSIMDQESTNNFINILLENCIANRQYDIKRYDEVYQKKED